MFRLYVSKKQNPQINTLTPFHQYSAENANDGDADDVADGVDGVEGVDDVDVDVEIPESELPSVIHKIGHDFGDWLELRKKTIQRFLLL